MPWGYYNKDHIKFVLRERLIFFLTENLCKCGIIMDVSKLKENLDE